MGVFGVVKNSTSPPEAESYGTSGIHAAYPQRNLSLEFAVGKTIMDF